MTIRVPGGGIAFDGGSTVQRAPLDDHRLHGPTTLHDSGAG
jgi:hypothetical protein